VLHSHYGGGHIPPAVVYGKSVADESMNESVSVTEAACKPVIGFTSTKPSACNAENLGVSTALLYCVENSCDCVSASLSDLKRLIISNSLRFQYSATETRLSGLISAHGIFTIKFHKLKAIYKYMFSAITRG
jgi:hypothetical protein